MMPAGYQVVNLTVDPKCPTLFIIVEGKGAGYEPSKQVTAKWENVGSCKKLTLVLEAGHFSFYYKDEDGIYHCVTVVIKHKGCQRTPQVYWSESIRMVKPELPSGLAQGGGAMV